MNITDFDKHLAEIEHEFDLHTECANKCGAQLHILPSQKVSISALRIPRGYLCDGCKEKVKNVKKIKEDGEKKNES